MLSWAFFLYLLSVCLCLAEASELVVLQWELNDCRLCSGSIALFMTLNIYPFNSAFLHYQIHLSSHSFILISSMSLVISPTQLPMFLSQSNTWIQLGNSENWTDWSSSVLHLSSWKRCGALVTPIQMYTTHTHTYTSRQSEEMALPKHKLHSMLARICIHSGLNNKDCFYQPTV